MSELLDEYGVRTSFQSRVLAVLGEAPSKPPKAVLDGQLSNEYFAYFVLEAQSLKYTVRNAYELIGGGFNKVAENVRRVKLFLPVKDDPSKEVDALSALKAEIRADERRLLNIELLEQEEFYVEKLSKQEQQHHKDHDKIIASNAKLTTQSDMLQVDNQSLKAQLLELQARERDLNNSYSQVQSELRGTTAKLKGLEQLITEKSNSMELLQVANAQTLSAYSSKLKGLSDELDEYRITNKKLVNEISAQREALSGSNDALRQARQQLEKKALLLQEQLTLSGISNTLDKSLAALNPICDLVGDLLEARKTNAINVKSVVTAIQSVDGKVADVNGKVGVIDNALQQVLAALEQNKDE